MKPAQEAPSGITLWRRIADELAQDIAGGDYASGERLPGENDMARHFGVNRHTVRRALAELSERGLVSAAAVPLWTRAGFPIRSARARGFRRSSAGLGMRPKGG
jgi:DNA-binding transcriptional MocR family regulator